MNPFVLMFAAVITGILFGKLNLGSLILGYQEHYLQDYLLDGLHIAWESNNSKGKQQQDIRQQL